MTELAGNFKFRGMNAELRLHDLFFVHSLWSLFEIIFSEALKFPEYLTARNLSNQIFRAGITIILTPPSKSRANRCDGRAFPISISLQFGINLEGSLSFADDPGVSFGIPGFGVVMQLIVNWILEGQNPKLTD
jgi:hypothetical protein